MWSACQQVSLPLLQVEVIPVPLPPPAGLNAGGVTVLVSLAMAPQLPVILQWTCQAFQQVLPLLQQVQCTPVLLLLPAGLNAGAKTGDMEVGTPRVFLAMVLQQTVILQWMCQVFQAELQQLSQEHYIPVPLLLPEGLNAG